MAGTVQRVWIKRAKQGPMDSTTSIQLRVGAGIVGNADQGGRRQVTLFEEEIWDELMRAVLGDVPPKARRANILVRGFPLRESRGRVLRIGTCRLTVRGEAKPCEQMEEACAGLQAAMFPSWYGGAYADVLSDGDVTVGDEIAWEAND